MEYTQLGALTISRLIFGCEPLGGTDWGSYDVRDVVQAIRYAWEQGVTTFDVADVYSLGRAEVALAEALGAARHQAVIITKGGVAWTATREGERADTRRDSSPDYIRQAIQNSLRRLDIEAIPLYLIHWPDPQVPFVETLGALQEARLAGEIQNFGISNFYAINLDEALRAQLTALEIPYNLIQRDADEAIASSLARQVGVLAYGPLAQGLLSGKYNSETPFPDNDRRHRLPHFAAEAWGANQQVLARVQRVAAAHGKSIAQVSLRWVLDRSGISGAVAGAKSTAQVAENIGALDWRMTPAEWRALVREEDLLSTQG